MPRSKMRKIGHYYSYVLEVYTVSCDAASFIKHLLAGSFRHKVLSITHSINILEMIIRK